MEIFFMHTFFCFICTVTTMFFIHIFFCIVCTVTTTVNKHAAWVLGMHTKDLSCIISKKLGGIFPGHLHIKVCWGSDNLVRSSLGIPCDTSRIVSTSVLYCVRYSNMILYSQNFMWLCLCLCDVWSNVSIWYRFRPYKWSYEEANNCRIEGYAFVLCTSSFIWVHDWERMDTVFL